MISASAPSYKSWPYPLSEINFLAPKEEENVIFDCFGGVTQKKYFGSKQELLNGKTGNVLEAFTLAYNEDLHAFIDLVGAIESAKQSFCMVELGAGYGRWLALGANACNLMNKPLGTLIACEAEPTHYKWMQEHFRDNKLNPEHHKLVWGIVSDQAGSLPFYVGKSDSWYGQSIAQNVIEHGSPASENPLKKLIKKILGRSRHVLPDFIDVPCHSLDSLLEKISLVDFMHMDIQGAEFDVLSTSMETLNQKVKKIHVGTHSPDVEPTKGRDMDLLIYTLFQSHGWENINRIAPLSQQEYDGHTVHFVDGVQTWNNPRLQNN